MVELYKDVKNLCLEFAGIRESKVWTVDEQDLLNTYEYKCDLCDFWKYENWAYKRDYFHVIKNEIITDNGNEINTHIKKLKFMRLHLCWKCKKSNKLKTVKGVSVKTSEINILNIYTLAQNAN